MFHFLRALQAMELPVVPPPQHGELITYLVVLDFLLRRVMGRKPPGFLTVGSWVESQDMLITFRQLVPSKNLKRELNGVVR